MNREVKFRGKMIDNKELVYGYYFMNKYGEVFILDTEGYIEWAVIPETVGQYTWLKDNLGFDAFEGDKVFIYYLDGEVEEMIIVWSDDDCGFRFKDKEGVLWKLSETQFTIFGNIHE